MPGTGLEVAGEALAFATSALDAVVKISSQLGAERDLAFIRDEFAMMRAFLKTADGAARSGKRPGKVVDAWVRQVRALAYDVEDCLDDATLHLLDRRRRPSPGCLRRLPHTVKAMRRVADNIGKLRARVENVSDRNLRYRLIDGGGPSSQPPPAAHVAWSSAAHRHHPDAARREEEGNLARLVSGGGSALRVVAVWGRDDAGAGDGDEMTMASLSVVREAYDAVVTRESFPWRAWVTVAHPLNPRRLVEALVRQFYANSIIETSSPAVVVGIEAARKMEEMMVMEEVFERLVKDKRYLFVLDDLAGAEEWLWIKTYLADYGNGSRVIVRTRHKGIAMLCLQQPVSIQVSDSEFNESMDGRHPPVYLMFSKDQDEIAGGSDTAEMKQQEEGHQSNSGATTTTTTKQQQAIDRRDSISVALEQNRLVGRDIDASNLIKLVRDDGGRADDEFVLVLGASRVGKSALVKSICQSGRLRGTFERIAWFTVRCPFNRDEFISTIREELLAAAAGASHKIKKGADAFMLHGNNNRMNNRAAEPPMMRGNRGNNLVVVDDVSSKDELYRIRSAVLLLREVVGFNIISRVIVITREPSVANLFHRKDRFELLPLQPRDALELFKKKVKVDLQDKDLSKVVEEIVKKCGGLPQIISTIAGYLQEVDPKDWKRFRDNMSSELVNKPELKDIDRMLTTGYKNLPSNLKSCFLYLSVFPEDNVIRQRRLVRRWIAEGYSSAKHGTSAEQVADKQFHDLISRNMIQPSGTTINKIGNNQEACNFGFQNLMHGVSRKKSAEENLVLVLDKDDHSISLQARSRARHLTVMEGWSREEKKSNALESIVDLCHLRSLTVFGKFKSFFISRKMRLLRLLDLEGTDGIRDCDLSPISKLRHLRYLSLRGTGWIFHLPDSLGYLSNLETLDVRGTLVTKLPSTIVKLQRLKYLRAGIIAWNEDDDDATNFPSELWQHWTMYFINLLSRQESIDKPTESMDEPTEDFRLSIAYTCLMVNVWLRGFNPHGVEVPRRIGKLRALQTLGVVNVARGTNVLKEIKKLIQLRKLGITGIKMNHCKDLGSAISSCSHLQTLSMRAEGKDGLVGCLDGVSPPEDLQSLKLYGNLGRLPTWIGELQSLVKLTFRSTLLEQDAVQVLGELHNLNSLRLFVKSFKGEELHFHLNTFASLVVLEIDGLSNTRTVKFEEPTMARLKLLKVNCWWSTITDCCSFTGISHLPNLMEVLLNGLDCGESEEYFQESDPKIEMPREFKEWLAERQPLWVKNRALKEDLLAQLEVNVNRPSLKMEY